MAKETKTNAMRILDRESVPYITHSYDHSDGKIDGVSVAAKLGQDARRVFKTLVTKGKTEYYVFVIPVDRELNLKKAAASVDEKAVELIPAADLRAVTGYIRGGCSPIGMKKRFLTVFDGSALDFPTIMVSAGRLGLQMEADPASLLRVSGGITAALLL